MTLLLALGVILGNIFESGCLSFISVRPVWWTVRADEGESVVLPCRAIIQGNDSYSIAWYRGSPLDGRLIVNKTAAGNIYTVEAIEGTNYTDRISLQLSQKQVYGSISHEALDYVMQMHVCSANMRIEALMASDSGNYSCVGTVYADDAVTASGYVFLNVTEQNSTSGIKDVALGLLPLELAYVGTVAMLPVLPALVFLGKAAYTGIPLAPYFSKCSWTGFCIGLYLHIASTPILWINYMLTLDGISKDYIKGWGSFLLAVSMTLWVSCILRAVMAWFRKTKGLRARQNNLELENGTNV